MIANRNFGECQPLTWVGRVPVYLATALAGVQAVSMIVTALVQMMAGPDIMANPILRPLIFNAGDIFRHGWVWEYVTYIFVNPPGILFVAQLFMFAWFGSDVEKFLGRRSFIWLYCLLVVAMPLLLTVLALINIDLGPYLGSGSVSFAVFLAFAMIYPRAQIFFGLEARWLALIFLVVNSLQCMAAHAWGELAMLWWGGAVAALWLRYEGVSSLQMTGVGEYFRRKHSEKKLQVVRPEKKKAEPEVHDSIDPILEKIARQGIGSLTRSEREKLERARAVLLEKERRS